MHPRIQHLIQHPFEVQLSDVAVLQDEIEKYPYFSTLRTLLLFGLKEFDHASYQDELKKTSIYCPSRVALYHYLQKEKQESTQVEFENESISEIEASQPKNLEVVSNDISTEQIIQSELSETNSDEIVEEFIPSDEPKIDEGEIIITELETEIEPKVEPKNSAFTFSEWLNLPKKEETNSTQKINSDKAPSEKEIKFQLIEEFIEKAPKITPPSKDSSHHPIIEKPSNSEEYSDLMTETLAQIYTEQKKYDKALRAYKILMIKYPEKEEYFMEKIEYIDYLMNSK